MISAIRHTGLVVQDLDRAVGFYEGLGMVLQARQLEEGSYIDRVVGLKDASVEWAKLSAPDGALLELLHYHSHPEGPASRPASSVPSNRHGCSHLAFTVESVDAAVTWIQAHGGSLVGEVALDPAGRHRVAYCTDPEGILLEIVEVVERTNTGFTAAKTSTAP